MAFVVVLASCRQDEFQKGTVDNLSPFAKSYLGLRNNSSAQGLAGSSTTMNKSYSDAMVVSGAMPPSGSVTKSDTTIVDVPWYNCATQTDIKNNDGSITMITDYGDGCMNGSGEYRYMMWGKSIYTYFNSYTKKGSVVTYEYRSKSKTINMGGRYYYGQDSTSWNSNGSSTYSGHSTYDTATQTFSGSYAYSDTSDYTYGNYSYRYRGHGQSSYSQNGSLISASDYYYENGDNFYQSTVILPLFSNYKCYANADYSRFCAILMYVSGRERIHYRQDGKEGTFEIDYGNGECDNLITIIENGVVVTVDQPTIYALAAQGAKTY